MKGTTVMLKKSRGATTRIATRQQ